jgi:hypothetical protein
MKSIKNIFALVGLILLLGGCANNAKVLQVPGNTEQSKYGPQNEKRLTGIVAYKLGGDAEANREEAYKKMFDTCNGKYNIIKEWEQSKGGVFVYGAFVKIRHQYIEFNCIKYGKDK